MPGRFVLDAFALVAFLLNEPGASRIRRLLEEGAAGDSELSVTAVNLGEAVYTIWNRRGEAAAADALAASRDWSINIINIDERLAIEAARIKAQRRMGYLDCFVVALALALDATVVTGDPDFHRVDDAISIEWLATA